MIYYSTSLHKCHLVGFFCNLNFLKHFVGQEKKFVILIAKSTSPGVSATTSFFYTLGAKNIYMKDFYMTAKSSKQFNFFLFMALFSVWAAVLLVQDSHQ